MSLLRNILLESVEALQRFVAPEANNKQTANNEAIKAKIRDNKAELDRIKAKCKTKDDAKCKTKDDAKVDKDSKEAEKLKMSRDVHCKTGLKYFSKSIGTVIKKHPHTDVSAVYQRFPEPSTLESYLYVFSSESDIKKMKYKIGISTDDKTLKTRLTGLNTSRTSQGWFLKSWKVKNVAALEKMLHMSFKSAGLHVSKEWVFAPCGEKLLELIDLVVAPHNAIYDAISSFSPIVKIRVLEEKINVDD